MDRHISTLHWRLHSTPQEHRPRYAHRALPLVATSAVRDRVASPWVLCALRPRSERSRAGPESVSRGSTSRVVTVDLSPREGERVLSGVAQAGARPPAACRLAEAQSGAPLVFALPVLLNRQAYVLPDHQYPTSPSHRQERLAQRGGRAHSLDACPQSAASLRGGSSSPSASYPPHSGARCVLYRRRVVQIPLGDSGSVRARLDPRRPLDTARLESTSLPVGFPTAAPRSAWPRCSWSR